MEEGPFSELPKCPAPMQTHNQVQDASKKGRKDRRKAGRKEVGNQGSKEAR